MGGEEAFEIGDAAAGPRRDHEGGGKGHAFVERLGERQQRGLFDQIDLVEHQHLGRADIAQRAQDRLVVLMQAFVSVDQ